MAVTASDLAIELRLSVDGQDLETVQTTVLTRLVNVATALVDAYAPDCPDAVNDEAVIRTAAYLYDVPPGAQANHTNALAFSGAQALIAPWRVQRAYAIGGDAPDDLESE